MNRKIRLTGPERRATSDERIGSALILTVVLTSLLAIVGVLFIMMARVNKIASSGLSESKELDAAVETVIARISEELALDIPRKGPNDVELSEYYDYPGQKDKWLASLEPSTDPNRWRQISDVTGYIEKEGWDTQDIGINGNAIIEDHEEIELDDGDLEEQLADADGDGIADSKWIEVNDITSSRGEPIYAAIRIVDNGGMMNVNTAYKFNPDSAVESEIDGSSLMQINLMALSWRPPDYNTYDAQSENDLREARCGDGAEALYEQNVIWRYNDPYGPYTPFDISDELELRNRFLVNHPDIDTRLEELGLAQGRSWEFRTTHDFRAPVGTGDLAEWFISSYDDGSLDPNYAYRHIATTYNMDRTINPSGERMVNVNRINDINDVNFLYGVLLNGLDPCLVDVDRIAAQIAVNLKDYRDDDSDVTSFVPDVNGPAYYGFECPCVYISELAHRFVPDFATGATYSSYAVELYKPYSVDNDPSGWWLVVNGGPPITINSWTGGEQFCVIQKEDSNAPLPAIEPGAAVQAADFAFDGYDIIRLQRPVDGNVVTVDSVAVPPADMASGWLQLSRPGDPIVSIQRDITPHKCIRRLWAGTAEANSPTLGGDNNFQYAESPDVYIQAHPTNQDFTNVGEIGMLFREDVYRRNWSSTDTEADVRINLAGPEFRQIFNYLTVWPPSEYVSDPNETRVKGRININTAPWFVLAQLPWMQYQDSNSIPFERAKAITDYRDNTSQGFWNIGELMLVNKMLSLGADGKDNWNGDMPKGPDLTYDNAQDDFEERDVIFARISNLVTVRSDVFTAYILVRIDTDGPQKRVIAILDRSDVYSPTDKVKIVAVHPVADPR